jgi:hypothetical protein
MQIAWTLHPGPRVFYHNAGLTASSPIRVLKKKPWAVPPGEGVESSRWLLVYSPRVYMYQLNKGGGLNPIAPPLGLLHASPRGGTACATKC